MLPKLDVVLKRFESPDEIRTFEKGKFELVRLGRMTIGRATLQSVNFPHVYRRSTLTNGALTPENGAFSSLCLF